MVTLSNKNLTLILFISLIISSAYTYTLPGVNAQSIADSQKAIGVLNSVVGLNTNAYRTVLNLGPNLNITTVGSPQDSVLFNLTSAESSLRARCSFVNDTLHEIYLSDYIGSPSLNVPATNSLEMVTGFLSRYQSYTNNTFYGGLSSMVNCIALNANATKTYGNVKLEYSVVGNQTEEDFVWTYVDNAGIPALSKNVILSYANGHLQGFLDNWQLYKIDGVPKLSSQDALAAASRVVQNFSYIAYNVNGANVTVSGFRIASIGNASLSYLNYYEQTARQAIRGGDSYTLYPSWYVPLGFDKIYPSNVTGLNVRVWADTGQISSVDPIYLDYQPTTSNASLSSTPVQANQVTSISAISILVVAGLSIMTGLILYSTMTKPSGFKRLWISHVLKHKIASMCLAILILITLVFLSVPKVAAISSIKSEIYVATYPTTSLDSQEFSFANNIANHIQLDYTIDGVDSCNNYGSQTNRYNIMYNIMNDESSYSGIMVFHFGPAYFPDYLDSTGTPVYSWDIYASTLGYNNHYFVWMWSCTLAGFNGQSLNHIFAGDWTQTNLDASDDGYNFPDDSGHVFIGFQGQSAAISSQSFRYYTQLAYLFPIYFYNYAVGSGYNVHDSLNLASYDLFGVPYGDSYDPLYSGYESYYPGYIDGPPYPPGMEPGWVSGQMRVFGDSNVVIRQDPPYSWLTVETVDEQYNQLDVNIYLNGNWVGTGCVSVYLQNGAYSVSGDDYVWDDNLQDYVYYEGSTWGGYLTQNTYSYIYYGYWN
jgi:hypothetical protein